MIKIFVILMLFGIIAAQDAATKPEQTGNEQIQLFGSKGIFKKPLFMEKPFSRLTKRNSSPATESDKVAPFQSFLAKLQKFKRSFEENRNKKKLMRPARAFKYCFNNGGCGCSGGAAASGGAGSRQSAACKCDHLTNAELNNGKS